MYEIKDGVLCIPAKALHEELGVITLPIYNNKEFRKKLNFIQKGGNGRKALIAFDTLPPDLKEKVIEKIGKPTPEDKKSRVEAFYITDERAKLFYETYILEDGRNLDDPQIKEYTANASMLQAIEATVNETIITKMSRGGNKKPNWEAIAQTVASLKEKLGHSLPENERRLREKIKDYKKGGYEVLIRKSRYMNKNAAKVDDIKKESVLQEFIANGRNLDNAQIRDIYNAIAKNMGWKSITSATVSKWRGKLKRVTEPGRRGSKHYDNTISMQVKRTRPSAPLYYLTADGWVAELFYQKRNVNGKGDRVTTYHHRLTVVVILDAFNNYPLGYAIGDKESPELIKDAMRNAIIHSKELFGHYCQAWQVQSDNYQKKNLTSFWQTIGDKWTPAKVGNAKSKVIEPYFKDLNRKCQLMENWAGHNITAKSDKQVNDEWLNKEKKSFPDAAGCRNQIVLLMESERNEKREKYVNAYNALPEDDKLIMSQELFLYKFGRRTEPNKLEGQGISPRIGGVEHFYDCFDLNFRNHLNERWILHYDPDDLTQALAVAKDNTQLRFMVKEKHLQPMALRDRKEIDTEKLQEIRDFNKLDREDITQRRAEGLELVQELFLTNKEIDGSLVKLLITDSKGQHKDRRFGSDPQDVEFENVTERKKEEAEYLRSKTNLNKYLE